MLFVYIAGLVAIAYGALNLGGAWASALIPLGIFWFFCGLLFLKEYKIVRTPPPLEIDSVVVISKFVEQRIRGNWMWTNTAYTYFVTFEFSNGERKKITVDAKQYGTIFEGDMGVIEYKEYLEHTELVSFHPQA